MPLPTLPGQRPLDPTHRFAQQVAESVAAKAADSGAAYKAFKEKYKAAPLDFARDCIKWQPGERLCSYQEELLAAYGAHDRLSWYGGRGVRKSSTIAMMVLHFCLTRAGHPYRDFKCGLTAGVERQLKDFLWTEVQYWAERLNWDRIGRQPFKKDVEMRTMGLHLQNGFATCFVSNDPNKLEGLHARDVLLVIDECKAVPRASLNSLLMGLTGTGKEGHHARANVIAAGCPGPRSDWFFELHSGDDRFINWHTKHITLEMAMADGVITPQDLETNTTAAGGEGTTEFKRYVLGDFADDEETALIPLEHVLMAVERWKEKQKNGGFGRIDGIGVDVADGGGNDSCFALCAGNSVVSIELSRERVSAVCGHATQLADAHEHEDLVIAPDCRGMGAQLTQTMQQTAAGLSEDRRRRKWRVEPFDASGKVDKRLRDGYGMERPGNKRSAAWMYMAWLLNPANSQNVALPNNARLKLELTTPRRITRPDGVVFIEAKEDIAKRLDGRSTDVADAVIQSLSGGRIEIPKRVAQGCYPSLAT